MHGLARLGVWGPCVAICLAAAWPFSFVAAQPTDWPAIVRADSLLFARALASQTFDSLLVALDAHIPLARRDGRRDYLGRALTAQGVAWLRSGDAQRAEAALAEATEVALAAADTAQALLALQQRAYTAGTQGDLATQRDHAVRMLDLARRSGQRASVAIAENFLGWNFLQRGDQRSALEHLELAVLAHRELQNDADEAIALTSYGGALFELGHFETAAAAYTRQIELAHRLENQWLHGQALVGLADVQWQVGDPAAAIGHYTAARHVQQLRSSPIDEALVLLRLSSMEREQNRPQTAERIAREALAICERHGFSRVRASGLNELAQAQAACGRVAAATQSWQEVLAMGEAADGDSRVDAALGLTRLLLQQGDVHAARGIVERAQSDLADECALHSRHLLLAHLAETRRAAGDLDGADVAARTLLAQAETHGLLDDQRIAWEFLARCQWDRGEWDLAEQSYERACAAWERLRLRSGDPSWREWWGASGIDLGTEYATFLLDARRTQPDSTRVRLAYEIAARFKTRTLRERIAGPSHFATDTPDEQGMQQVSLAELQASLHDEESLFEWFCGTRRSLVFVVSAQDIAAYELEAQDELAAWVQAAHDLAAASDSSDDLAGELGANLLRHSFGEATARVDTSRTWVLAPDGPLHRMPFTLLLEATTAPRQHWLTASAAVLVQARRNPSTSPQGIWVQRGANVANEANLPAAEREVRWIERHLKSVVRSDDAPGFDVQTRWAEHGVLHFAGHTRFDDQHPWRSGIQLHAATASTSGDSISSLLHAAQIARLRLPARLAVLASCSSAGGRIQNGEGVAGLSGAFLAAGVPAVVASLWPVNDEATALLMQAFYRALSKGATVADALRQAQTQLRTRSATRAPRDWAGFVVIGDGSIRPTVVARPLPTPPLPRTLTALAAGAALLAGLLGWRRQTRAGGCDELSAGLSQAMARPDPGARSDEDLVRESFVPGRVALPTLLSPSCWLAISGRSSSGACATCASAKRALDLSQEVMMKIWESLPRFHFQSKFSWWVFVITRNRCLNALAEPRARHRHEELDPGLAHTQLGSDERLEALENISMVRHMMLLHLDAQERQALALSHFEQLPVEEITRLLGLSNATGARALLQRARRKLRTAVERHTRDEARP